MLGNASFGRIEWVSPGKCHLCRDLNDEKEQAMPGPEGRPQRVHSLWRQGRIGHVRDPAGSQCGWGTTGERGRHKVGFISIFKKHNGVLWKTSI